MKINPFSNAAKKRLGRIYVQLRDVEKALPYLNAAAAEDPKDPDVHRDLGRVYELTKHWDEAVAEYQLASDLDPTVNRLHYVLARIYRQLGKEDLARQQLEQFKANEEADRQARVERIQRLRQKEAPQARNGDDRSP